MNQSSPEISEIDLILIIQMCEYMYIVYIHHHNLKHFDIFESIYVS